MQGLDDALGSSGMDLGPLLGGAGGAGNAGGVNGGSGGLLGGESPLSSILDGGR